MKNIIIQTLLFAFLAIVFDGTIHDYTAIVTRGANTFTTAITLTKQFDHVRTVEVDTITTTLTTYH